MSASVQEIDRTQLKNKLDALAKEISADLAQLESAQSKELLSDFVSELFLSVAKQGQQEFRRQKQAEGIAAAKAKGVRFGRTRKPLPDNFDAVYQAWRDGAITLTQAASDCGISRSLFYNAVARREQADNRAG